jgi:tripeptide aminopeptidase
MLLMRRFVVGLLLAIVPTGIRAQDPAGVARLVKAPAVHAVLDDARAAEGALIEDQIRYCEVPAPPFEEQARGRLLRQEFERVGLTNVHIDAAGNVLGDRPGASLHPHLVIAAHLDTVFPEGSDVTVHRDGARLRGLGISDDCRGLAVLVGIAQALERGRIRTPGSITFVADTGEEGLGDLRGMKRLFGEMMKGEIDRFVSIDGAGLDIVHLAVGSHRYRVTFHGPGGHSFGAFGLPNPAGALGRAIAKLQELRVPADPRTTFNVGRIGGGTSVNAIPSEAWMEIDLRSADQTELARIDSAFQRFVDEAVREENARWDRPGVVTATREMVGDRPAGATAVDSPMVQTAVAVTNALQLPVLFAEGSTDANLPMSLHIPAITIGGGGDARGVHSTDESFDPTDSYLGTERAILLTIALAQ